MNFDIATLPEGYRITTQTINAGNRHLACLFKMLRTGQWRLMEGFWFRSEEERDKWVNKRITALNKAIGDKSELYRRRKEIQETMTAKTHGYRTGDILYESWGYDQTNIDFYKVIEVKDKSVTLQPIGGTHVESVGYDAYMTKPNPDKIIGSPISKRIMFSVMNNNDPRFYISSRHGSFQKYKGTPVYESHYA